MLTRQAGQAAERQLSTERRGPATHALEPGRLAHLLARARPRALDTALIAGADPSSSRQLAARARLLTSASHRTLLASSIERLTQSAYRPVSRRRVCPCREAVLANAQPLRELATRLRADRPLYARGIAIVDELVSDGTGPIYRGGAAALAQRLSVVFAATSGAE
jgi:hypothetical protein